MVQFQSLFVGGASRNARFRTHRLPAALATGLALVLIPAAAAQAAVFVVTTTADGNNGACTVSLCTLRDAVIAANASPGSGITLPSNASPYTLTLTGVNEDFAATGDLDVRANLTINGGGAATTIIDGNATDRVFQLIGAVTLNLNNLTVRNGSTAASSSKSGGGISGGSVILSFSVLSGNNGATGQGGGIFANNVTLTNSTVSGNTTSDQGGGIFAGSVTMTNSTISGNQSTGDQGGGLFLINGSSTITNSTISGIAPRRRGRHFLNGSTNVNSPADDHQQHHQRQHRHRRRQRRRRHVHPERGHGDDHQQHHRHKLGDLFRRKHSERSLALPQEHDRRLPGRGIELRRHDDHRQRHQPPVPGKQLRGNHYDRRSAPAGARQQRRPDADPRALHGQPRIKRRQQLPAAGDRPARHRAAAGLRL